MNTLKTSEKCGIIETLNWIESWEKKNRLIINHAEFQHSSYIKFIIIWFQLVKQNRKIEKFEIEYRQSINPR